MTESDLVATGEAAKALGVSGALLRQGAREGWLSPAQETPGGHYRWSVPDLERQFRRIREQRKQQ